MSCSSKIPITLGIFIALLMVGCGGGGDGGESSATSEFGFQDNLGTPSKDGKLKLEANYGGSLEVAKINTKNFAMVAHEAVYWNDIKNFILYDDARGFSIGHPKFFKYYNRDYMLPESQNCESGSIELPTIDADNLKSSYIVRINNCKIGPLISNGTLKMHVIKTIRGTPKKIASEFSPTFSVQDVESDATYTVTGYIVQSMEESLLEASFVFGQAGKTRAWVDEKFTASGETYNHIYLPDYGKVILSTTDNGRAYPALISGDAEISFKNSYNNYLILSLLNSGSSLYGPFDQEHVNSSYEPFTTGMLKIPFEHFSPSSLSEDTGPNVPAIQVPNVVSPNELHTMKVTELKATDYDLSQLKWTIADELGEVFSEGEQWQHEYTFESSGVYTVTLNATDSFGNTATASEQVYVTGAKRGLLSLEADISVNRDLTEGELFSAQLNVENLDKYIIKLTSGPKSMTLSASGGIAWDGQLDESYHFADTVHYSIEVIDEEQNKSITVLGEVAIPTNTKVSSVFHFTGDNPTDNRFWPVGADKAAQLLPFSDDYKNGIYWLTLQDGQLKVDTNLLSRSSKGSVLDVNFSNDTQSMVYLYANELGTSAEYESFQSSGDVNHIFEVTTPSYRSAPRLIDLNGDGTLEVANMIDNNRIEIFDATYVRSEYQLPSDLTFFTGQSWKACDLDGDGNQELVFSATNPTLNEVKLVLSSYKDNALTDFEVHQQGYYQWNRGTVDNTLFIDQDNNGVCEGLLTLGENESGEQYLSWYGYEEGGLIKKEQLDTSEFGSLYHDAFAIADDSNGTSGILFQSDNGLTLVGYDQIKQGFIANTYNYVAGLEVTPNINNSTIIGQSDIDGDGARELILKHFVSSQDAISSTLLKHGYISNGSIDSYYIAASLTDNKIEPKYISNLSTRYPYTSTDDRYHIGSRVIPLNDGGLMINVYGHTDIIDERSTLKNRHFPLGYGNDMVMRSDGSYYQKADSEYILYDVNRVEQKRISIPYSGYEGGYVLAAYDGLELVRQPEMMGSQRRHFLINEHAGQIKKLEYVKHVSPHPEFSKNGLIYVYLHSPHWTHSTDAEAVSKVDNGYRFSQSGVYKVTKDDIELVHSWQEKVFSIYQEDILDVYWANNDDDPEFELIHHVIKTSEYGSVEQYSSYAFVADQNGDNLKYFQTSRYIAQRIAEEVLSNGMCIDNACRDTIRMGTRYSSNKAELAGYDKVTGYKLWSRTFSMNETEGRLAYFDDKQIYIWANGLHVIK
ncbi:PKD domain-containing protein [Pseudoalteromonas obscura]|uniref:PKD domain-containing protein n=1 Tax=Pseudoalteromonas obscura TaxID=3048491 RepID=A0ABT7EGD6_9GAMM|nr:PKD domain-containing protein [Pseudoalteromonas sp. P94(2023)]MDK2594107.1 PKD domain-containing protein [Pseudoalteromonas sp. P94(2023)]